MAGDDEEVISFGTILKLCFTGSLGDAATISPDPGVIKEYPVHN